jgi:hypothetical protein
MNKLSSRSIVLTVLLASLVAACAAEDEGVVDMDTFDPGAGIAQDALTGRTVLRTADGDVEVGYDVVGGHALVEGDIDLGPVDQLRGVGDPTARSNTNLIYGAQFPSSTIFYVKPTFNVSAIVAAMNDITAKTDVDFVQLPVALPGLSGIQFALSSDPGVSSSPVGYQGGFQTVKVWSTHGQGVVEHEVLHALGMWHEQQRIDRDSFITVNLGCAPIDRWHNFDKTGLPVGVFDFNSIMIYGSFSFSFIPNCPVMTKKNGATFSGNSVLSAGDIAAVNLLY